MITQIDLNNITQYAKAVNVYIEGDKQIYPVGEDNFNKICVQWNAMLESAHIMPAFGVSLHNETVREMKKGVWMEFDFDGQYSSNGMSYEKLLVAVRPEWMAFNIVRYTSERGYDGRCFHYNLGTENMSDFYNTLIDCNKDR